jgi:hypothetical protein
MTSPYKFEVRKAKRKGIFGRIALMGPAGAGKSLTALIIAKGLTRNGKVFAIDTERGSLDNYADAVPGLEFDKIEPRSFPPEMYVDAINMAVESGYDTIVVDSLSHAWAGTGGVLEIKDSIDKRGGNSYTNWRDVTPMHNKLVDTLLTVPAHTIVTMRSKMEYVLEEDERGKKVPRRVGLAPVQRQDMEYELSLVGDLNHSHDLVVTKTRYLTLDGLVVNKPGPEFALKIREWLDGNSPELPPVDTLLKEVGVIMVRKRLDLSKILEGGFKNPRELDAAGLLKLLDWIKEV